MKKKCLFHLMSLLIFLLLVLNFGNVLAQSSSLPRKPNHKTIQQLLDKELGDCDCRKRSFKLIEKENKWHLLVIDQGIHDDSEKANKTSGFLVFENGKWNFKVEQKTWQCWPGRGHQDFSSKPCI